MCTLGGSEWDAASGIEGNKVCALVAPKFDLLKWPSLPQSIEGSIVKQWGLVGFSCD